MPVQVTPFQGTRLTDIVSRGAQINNQREGLRLQDVALGQRQQQINQRGEQQAFQRQTTTAQLGQAQERIKMAAQKLKTDETQAEVAMITETIKTAIEQNPQADPETLKAQSQAMFGQLVGDQEYAAQRFADAPIEAFQTSRTNADVRADEQLGLQREGLDLKRQQLEATTSQNALLNDAKLRKAEADASIAEQKSEDAGRKAAVVEETKKSLATLAAEVLKDPDTVDAVYGSIDGFLPTIGPDAVDAELKIRKLVNLLTLQNVDAVPGVLSDSDIKLLKEAGTTLSNFRLSDSEAKVELARIAGVLGLEPDSGGRPLNPTVDARPTGRFKVSVVE